MIEARSTIRGLYYYPIKGLSPQSLPRTTLRIAETIPGDRQYAIENGVSGFVDAAPAHLPKTRFLMLMRNARLAALQTRFDASSHFLSVCLGGRELARGNMREPAGCAAIEQFMAHYCASELGGAPKVLSAPGHSFSDVSRKVISIINLASVAAIESIAPGSVNPLRFRGNIYVQGWPSWYEFNLIGREIGLGTTVRLKITGPITRCAATNVDPVSGVHDLKIPQLLMQAFGHSNCGIYGEVVAAGDVVTGDPVFVFRSTDMQWRR